MKFGVCFDKPLPSSLFCLKLDYDFSFYTSDPLPPNLTHLFVGANFNLSPHFFPSSVQHLRFGSMKYEKCLFNLPLSNLPPNLTHLLKDEFDQPVDSLPSSLSHLTIIGNFNHPIDLLPPSLTYLIRWII